MFAVASSCSKGGGVHTKYPYTSSKYTYTSRISINTTTGLRGISTRGLLKPFQVSSNPFVFHHNNTISLLKNNCRSQFVRSFAEDKPDDKAATIEQLTSSFIKLVKHKELAEKEKKDLSSKSKESGVGGDDIFGSSTGSERIVTKPRDVDEDEEEEEEEEDEEEGEEGLMADDDVTHYPDDPKTFEDYVVNYPPDVAAFLYSEEQTPHKEGFNAFSKVVSESEALFAPNAMVDLDQIIDSSFYDAVEEWDAELEMTGLNWDWINFMNENDEEDWTGEETRVFQTMPNVATNWEAAWDHLHWIGDKYFAEMLDDTAAYFAKEFRVKEAFKDRITRMRQNRNKGRKERNAKRPADQKIPMMSHHQIFTNHFEWLLSKVPKDHPKAEKVFNCARLISRNATIPLKHRIIAIHILMEQLHMLPRRYSRGIPVLPPDFDEKVRKLGAR